MEHVGLQTLFIPTLNILLKSLGLEIISAFFFSPKFLCEFLLLYLVFLLLSVKWKKILSIQLEVVFWVQLTGISSLATHLDM